MYKKILLLFLICSSYSHFAISSPAWWQQNKSIIVVISSDDNANMAKVSQRILERSLRKLSLKVVNQALIRDNKSRRQLQAIADGDTNKAILIDLQADANYILQGELSISSGAFLFNSQLRTRNASITFTIYNTKKGQSVYTGSGSSSVPHIDKLTGSKKAIKQAVAEIIQDIKEE
jgi:hypothetical protein